MRRIVAGTALVAGISTAAVIRNRCRNNIQRYEQHYAFQPPEDNQLSSAVAEDPPRQLFRNLKWPTLIGNIGVGAAEVLAGGGSTLAVTVDGVHNIGDGAGYATQFYAEEAKQPEKVHRLRKIGHWIIASSSAIVGSKAAYDLATQNEHAVHPGVLAAAGASLALNGYIGRDIIPKVRKYGWRRLSGAQRDIAKHFALVDTPSSVLAVGGAVAAGASAHQTSAVAAVVSGAVGAWVFRPTERNLADPHACAAHDHHRHVHDESHLDHSPTLERPRPTRRRRVALLGAACVAAAGALVSTVPQAHAPETERQVAVSAAEANETPQKIAVEPAESDAATLYTVQPGDSLWTIVEDNLCQVKECSDQQIVNKIDKITERNGISNPDLIFPNQQLSL